MRNEVVAISTDSTFSNRMARLPVDGVLFTIAAALFFLGSAVLTQSGQPGASTPLPWMGSHLLWALASGAFYGGSVAHRRHDGDELPTILAIGAAALGVLHTLQWSAWVYVDVIAYRTGAQEILSEPLLHPFGSAHALLYGILVGSAVACLGWGSSRRDAGHRRFGIAGFAIGSLTGLLATTALLTVAATRSPASLGTVALIAVSYGWLFLYGANAIRNGRANESVSPQQST